jgi:hypothetical protein
MVMERGVARDSDRGFRRKILIAITLLVFSQLNGSPHHNHIMANLPARSGNARFVGSLGCKAKPGQAMAILTVNQLIKVLW